MTVDIKPWLHVDNYRELIDFMHKETTDSKGSVPTITSITKL